MRVLARGARVVPPRVHSDDRRAPVRKPHAGLQPRDAATQKVRSEFIGRGKFKILPDAEGVDALLTGNVVAVVATPVSLNLNGLATRYMLTMNASVELRDVKQNEVIWQNPGLLFRQEYDVETGAQSLDPATFFGQDANAFDRMTTDFARTIVSAILEAF
jgi:lipopolysaccharide assembly LptE-like protein